jgi:sugar phosphate isomerase/epimerase
MQELFMKLKDNASNTIWGLALAWYSEYFEGVTDPFLAKMDFLSRYGMKAFSAGLDEISSLGDAGREALFAALEKRDMHCILHSSIDHMPLDPAGQDRETDRQLALLERYIRPCRSSIVTTCAGDSHRYDRKMPWEEKIVRFSRIIGPVAKLCWDMGSPLGIENHADYFISDLLYILRETPRLYLFLDTANALHIGERPVSACLEAAPYVIGTHFKDHRMVRGETDPLHYEIRGCALGDGDAELDKQYPIIMEKSPFRDKLVMLFELFSPDDGTLSHLQCFEKSVRFVETLIRGGGKCRE